jgi:Raf kinase inhibitor-like YbhB/YbcL family protein
MVRFIELTRFQPGGLTLRKAIIASASTILLTAIALFAAGGASMKITSSAFQQGGNIPSKFTCDGTDTNPPLQITGVPPEAKSLVLIVDDPDAPSGLFTHWVVWNISPQTATIAEGSAPKGVHGTNDFGKSGYGPPCPPSGAHRYYFRVFALDRELALPAGAKRSQLDAAMKGHVIAQGELMGRYSRK